MRPEASRAARPARFVGRARELVLLTDALSGSAPLVLVEGEAGIGKTRLLREYLTSEQGIRHRTLTAPCPPLRRPQTLGPLTDALTRAVSDPGQLGLSPLAGTLRPLFPEWAQDLPPAPEEGGDASTARHRLFRAFEELLRKLRIELLIVEDVHWADEVTFEFLIYLAARTPRDFGLVMTSRPEDVTDVSLLSRLTSRIRNGTGGQRITLAPLDVTDTARFISSMLSDEPVSAEFAAFVHKRTEGVPLAIEESTQLLISRANGIRMAFEVPPTIRDAVLERVRRLPPDAQAALRALSVLTEPADDAMASAVAGMPADRTRAGLAQALDTGLLADAGRGQVTFRHALACQAVYESVAPPDRKVMHLRAGQALEGRYPPPVTRLVRHFQEAGETAQWCRYGEQAADRALASGDEAAAGELLHELITQAGLPIDDVIRLARKQPFYALNAQSRFEELIGAFRAVLSTEPLTPQQDADLRVQLGQALTATQQWADGRRELERAIPHLDHDRVIKQRAMMLLAWPRGSTSPVAEHLAWLRRAAQLAAPMTATERLRFEVDRVTALLMLGDEDGWAEAARLPADGPATREITRGQLIIGDQATRWGRYAEAASRLSHARELADKHGQRRLRDIVVLTTLLLDWFTGSWDGLAERAASLVAGEDVPVLQELSASLVTGLLSLATGATDRAEEQLTMVHAATRLRTETEFSIDPTAALGRLYLSAGRTAEALAVTGDLMAIIATKSAWLWATDVAPVRVAALITAGRPDEAGELVTAFERGLGAVSAPAPQAGLRLCRALLAEAEGDHALAASLFTDAAAAWLTLPRPYDALLARERAAICLLAAGREEEATIQLHDVLHELSQLGAAGDADRVDASLRRLGINGRRAWHGGRNGYGGQLSPRELQVVAGVVAGGTNAQIARSLSRSPKTIAVQVNSAMRKLGVSSRTALAVKALETRIVTPP